MLSSYLLNEFKTNVWISWGVPCILIGLSLLYRMVSQPPAMLSNSIITEGLSISLFLIYFRYLLEYALKSTEKPLVFATILSVVLISLRKQMINHPYYRHKKVFLQFLYVGGTLYYHPLFDNLLVWVLTKRIHDIQYKKLAVFAGLTLLSTTMNVIVVALGVFDQARYMIYNMILLYISLVLMAWQLCQVLANKFLHKQQ